MTDGRIQINIIQQKNIIGESANIDINPPLSNIIAIQLKHIIPNLKYNLYNNSQIEIGISGFDNFSHSFLNGDYVSTNISIDEQRNIIIDSDQNIIYSSQDQQSEKVLDMNIYHDNIPQFSFLQSPYNDIPLNIITQNISITHIRPDSFALDFPMLKYQDLKLFDNLLYTITSSELDAIRTENYAIPINSRDILSTQDRLVSSGSVEAIIAYKHGHVNHAETRYALLDTSRKLRIFNNETEVFNTVSSSITYNYIYMNPSTNRLVAYETTRWYNSYITNPYFIVLGNTAYHTATTTFYLTIPRQKYNPTTISNTPTPAEFIYSNFYTYTGITNPDYGYRFLIYGNINNSIITSHHHNNTIGHFTGRLPYNNITYPNNSHALYMHDVDYVGTYFSEGVTSTLNRAYILGGFHDPYHCYPGRFHVIMADNAAYHTTHNDFYNFQLFVTNNIRQVCFGRTSLSNLIVNYTTYYSNYISSVINYPLVSPTTINSGVLGITNAVNIYRRGDWSDDYILSSTTTIIRNYGGTAITLFANTTHVQFATDAYNYFSIVGCNNKTLHIVESGTTGVVRDISLGISTPTSYSQVLINRSGDRILTSSVPTSGMNYVHSFLRSGISWYLDFYLEQSTTHTDHLHISLSDSGKYFGIADSVKHAISIFETNNNYITFRRYITAPSIGITWGKSCDISDGGRLVVSDPGLQQLFVYNHPLLMDDNYRSITTLGIGTTLAVGNTYCRFDPCGNWIYANWGTTRIMTIPVHNPFYYQSVALKANNNYACAMMCAYDPFVPLHNQNCLFIVPFDDYSNQYTRLHDPTTHVRYKFYSNNHYTELGCTSIAMSANGMYATVSCYNSDKHIPQTLIFRLFEHTSLVAPNWQLINIIDDVIESPQIIYHQDRYLLCGVNYHSNYVKYNLNLAQTIPPESYKTTFDFSIIGVTNMNHIIGDISATYDNSFHLNPVNTSTSHQIVSIMYNNLQSSFVFLRSLPSNINSLKQVTLSGITNQIPPSKPIQFNICDDLTMPEYMGQFKSTRIHVAITQLNCVALQCDILPLLTNGDILSITGFTNTYAGISHVYLNTNYNIITRISDLFYLQPVAGTVTFFHSTYEYPDVQWNPYHYTIDITSAAVTCIMIQYPFLTYESDLQPSSHTVKRPFPYSNFTTSNIYLSFITEPYRVNITHIVVSISSPSQFPNSIGSMENSQSIVGLYDYKNDKLISNPIIFVNNHVNYMDQLNVTLTNSGQLCNNSYSLVFNIVTYLTNIRDINYNSRQNIINNRDVYDFYNIGD